MKRLTSSQVQYLVKLRKDKKFRNREKKVLISGEKTIHEIAKKYIPEMIISSNKQKNTLYTDASSMKRITGLLEPNELAAVFPMPKMRSLQKKKYLLVLDQIADPGNLGTLIRSALALGFDGVVVTPNSVDIFNDKALRAAKGATFFLPFSLLSPEEIITIKKINNFSFFAAHMKGKNVQKSSFSSPLMLLLGNEARGLLPWAKKNATLLSIPMKKSVESLNVAIAGSLLMYQIRKRL